MKEPCLEDRKLENMNSVKIEELDKRVQLHAEASRAAVALAANDLRARLDAMNEFRSALKDQAGTFVPRNELEHNFESIEKSLHSLELYKAQIEGKASQASVNFTWIISIGSLIVSLINLFYKVKV